MGEKLDQNLQKDLTFNQRSLPMMSYELASLGMDTHLSTTEHQQKTVIIQFVKKEVKIETDSISIKPMLDNNILPGDEEPIKPKKCDFCDSMFTEKEILKYHIEYVHSDLCDLFYTKKGSLERHVKSVFKAKKS